ncbi:hypothetical protein EJB05_05953, partial [Eragrostis curvula]
MPHLVVATLCSSMIDISGSDRPLARDYFPDRRTLGAWPFFSTRENRRAVDDYLLVGEVAHGGQGRERFGGRGRGCDGSVGWWDAGTQTAGTPR